MKQGIMLLTLAVSFILFSSIAFAAETSAPHFFFGTVTTNGHAAVDNLLITVQIDGSDIAATSTLNGAYGLNPSIFWVPDDPFSDRAGDTIEFFVGGVKAADYTFANGYSSELNLVVSGDFPTDNPPNNPGPGGSGPSGGDDSPSGGVPIPLTDSDEDDTEDVDETPCETDWVCSDWLDCVNGEQKRVCVDRNNCQDESTMPLDEQECTITKTQEVQRKQSPAADSNFFNKITGAVVGGGVGSWIALIVLIGIIAAIFLYVFQKNKTKRN